ncbi:cupin domain-containing protein [Corynebacterium variabile]|uniref:cupin domain-containing protein n=1 Tax=Corynebacterium variabile TaxID=1727 RepID=UPI0028986DCB|nr:cupin domain-containing protein [Corynebacterium variabile]
MTYFITHGVRDDSLHEPFEAGTVQWVRRPGDGGREALSSGFWKVEPSQVPGPVDLVSHGDETVHILEGKILIEPVDGEPFTLTAGSVASFNDGARSRWTILEPVVEFFVYS